MPVYAVRVSNRASVEHANWSGEVRARFETPLAFRVGGKIVDRPAEVGLIVKRGDVLARLDAQDLTLQSQAAGAQRAAAQTELSQQLADLERYRQLLARGFISQAEFDRRKSALDVARSRVAELRSYQNTSRNQAAYAVLSADEPGVVTEVVAERGQVVSAGQPVVRVAQLTRKDVVIAVPENRLAELRWAGELRIALWSRPGHDYHGQLREVSPVADPATRTYTAKIAVVDADEEMRLGMTARVRADAGSGDSLVLPLSALYRKQDQAAVWVIDSASGTVKLVGVKATALEGDQVAIGTGLREGDWVVTAGVHKLHAGQRVRVIESAP